MNWMQLNSLYYKTSNNGLGLGVSINRIDQDKYDCHMTNREATYTMVYGTLADAMQAGELFLNNDFAFPENTIEKPHYYLDTWHYDEKE